MHQSKQNFLASSLIAVLAASALAITSLAAAEAADTKIPAGMEMSGEMQMPKTAADYSAEAAKYDREAVELDAKVAQHAKMAAQYRGLSSGGSKPATAFLSLADHCERLAESYRKAALEARATAQSHRDMARMA